MDKFNLSLHHQTDPNSISLDLFLFIHTQQRINQKTRKYTFKTMAIIQIYTIIARKYELLSKGVFHFNNNNIKNNNEPNTQMQT